MEYSGSKSFAWKAEYSFLAVAAFLVVLYAYGEQNRAFISVFSNAVTPFEALAAFAMAVLALLKRRNGKGSWFFSVWADYTLGMLLWFLAESTWAVYTLLLGIEIPYPSVADAFWLAGYFPFLFALVLQAWPFRENFSSRNLVFISLLALVLAAIVLAVLIPPVLQEQSGVVTLAVSFAYSFLDIVLLTVAVPVFVLFLKGRFWRPLLYVMVGIVLQLVGDILFGWTFLMEAYYSGHPIDLLFDWSYLSLTLGFYLRLKGPLLISRSTST